MTQRLVVLAATLGLLAGCASYPHHEMRVYPDAATRPVHTVLVLPPVFPSKIKRHLPDDLPEMLPAAEAASGGAILGALREALSASVTVVSGTAVSEPVAAWAESLRKKYLDAGAVPTRAEPVAADADAVLLTTVRWYGTERNQYSYQVLWMKPRWIGPLTWDHTCDFDAVMVNARDGAILVDGRSGELVNGPARDPEALARATRAAARGLLDRLPVASSTAAQP